MHHTTDRIAHTTAFVIPVVEHWLEREIALHLWGSVSFIFIFICPYFSFRQKLWQTLLHDAVLSLCSFSDDDTPCRIFAGLADGTVAIIEVSRNYNSV